MSAVESAEGPGDEQTARVVPFCPCMHAPDYEGGDASRASTLVWRRRDYRVLDSEDVYVLVAQHRNACGLQPDLFGSEAFVIGRLGPR